MDAITTAQLIGIILGILFGTIIPFAISFGVAMKKRKEAKAEAEKARSEAERAEAEQKKAEAENEIAELAKGFIVEAENLYKDVDTIVKQNGGTCGAQKKDSVMTKILQACLTKGTPYDAEHWSTYVDNFVAATRKVNAK